MAYNRNPAELEADLERVARLYLRGNSQMQIARALEMSREQVRYSLTELRRIWRESSLANFTEVQDRELARIEETESAAWKSYELSQRPIEKRTVERDGDGASVGSATKTKVEQTTTAGDPRWLAVVNQCRDQRCKILGLYEAQKIKVETDANADGLVRVAVKDLSDEQLKLLIAVGRCKIVDVASTESSAEIIPQ